MSNMYLQTDRRWAAKNMDSVPYTLGRWGCTTTSIANGREALKMPLLDPKQLSDKVQYTKDGLILWGSMGNVGLKMVSYSRWFNKERANQALKAPDEFCVVELDGWHWGLLWSTKVGTIIHDPLFGIRPTWPKYKNITKTVILKRV